MLSIVQNAHRLVVFAENVEYINQHNKEADEGKHTFRLAINNYADLTQEELRQRNNYKVLDNEIAEPQLKTDADPDRPDNLDWTDAVSYVTKLSTFPFTVYKFYFYNEFPTQYIHSMINYLLGLCQYSPKPRFMWFMLDICLHWSNGRSYL